MVSYIYYERRESIFLELAAILRKLVSKGFYRSSKVYLPLPQELKKRSCSGDEKLVQLAEEEEEEDQNSEATNFPRGSSKEDFTESQRKTFMRLFTLVNFLKLLQ